MIRLFRSAAAKLWAASMLALILFGIGVGAARLGLPWVEELRPEAEALAAGLLSSVACGVVGTYVVLRGMAFFGDALAHAILPGVAVAYLAEANLFWGALGMGLLTALGIGYIGRRGQIKEDTAIGIVGHGIPAT